MHQNKPPFGNEACNLALVLMVGVALLIAAFLYWHVNRAELTEPDIIESVHIMPAGGRFAGYVEQCVVEGDTAFVQGWALDRKQDKNTPIEVYVENKQEKWVLLNSRVMSRPDIDEKFHIDYRNSAVGFSAAGHVDNVPGGAQLLIVKIFPSGERYGEYYDC